MMMVKLLGNERTKKMSMSLYKNFENEELAEVFQYLDNLRESGVTNMFGATPYIQNEFDIMDRDLAYDVLDGWMNTFDSESNVFSRAEIARNVN